MRDEVEVQRGRGAKGQEEGGGMKGRKMREEEERGKGAEGQRGKGKEEG